VPVDGLGHVGRFVADGVGDVLDRDAVIAHDRHGGVAALVGVPVANSGALSHPAEPPVEIVAGVLVPVLVAEDEVGLPPGWSGGTSLRTSPWLRQRPWGASGVLAIRYRRSERLVRQVLQEGMKLMNRSSKLKLTLFAAATVIGMITALAPAATAASSAGNNSRAIMYNSRAHIQTGKTATPDVAGCATAHRCYQIQSWGHPGYCLNAVASGVHNNGDKVRAWKCNWTNTNQLWTSGACHQSGTTAWCEIENAANTSKCLNANTAGGLKDGSTAQLWSCSSTAANNLWSFQTPDQPCFSINFNNPAFACLQVKSGNWILTTKSPWSGNGDRAEMWNAGQVTRPSNAGWGTFLYQG
jgi:hypothetical protein